MKNITFKMLIIFLLFSLTGYAQDEVLELYQGKVPGAIDHSVKENDEVYKGEIAKVQKVSVPTISVYHPKEFNKKHSAVLICPGGGYAYLSFYHEGVALAKWLNTFGVTGVVLKSRLPDDDLMNNKTDAPLLDAQKAMELIRDNADKWNIDPHKIGVMGFSAGGHLAASLSTHFNSIQRPDFSVLVYPVITMDKEFTHMGSRNALLGKEPSSENVLKYSNEKQVTGNTPPAFLVHSGDDPVVPYTNSVSYYEALLAHGVKTCELHIFQNGGHGYGMAQAKSGNVADWPELLEGWLKKNGWIKEN